MTSMTRQLFNSACKNEDFLKEIYEADGDKKPGFFASEMKKTIFACMYYGWLVGKYQNNWRQNL